MWCFFLIKCLDFGAEKIKLVSAVSLFRTGNQLFISTAHSCLRHSCQITSFVYTRVKHPNVQLRGKETKLYGDKYVASLGSLCFSGKWGDETQCHGQTTGQILSGVNTDLMITRCTPWPSSPECHSLHPHPIETCFHQRKPGGQAGWETTPWPTSIERTRKQGLQRVPWRLPTRWSACNRVTTFLNQAA